MNYFGVQPFVTPRGRATSQHLLSTKISGQVAHLDQSYQNEVTGQLIMNCQSENVYCFLNTLHKLKHLSSCYSVGSHTSQYASQAQAVGTKMLPTAPLKATLTQVQGPDSPGQAGAWNAAHAFLAYLVSLQRALKVDSSGCQKIS